MSSTGSVNNPNQPDPNSPDYWSDSSVEGIGIDSTNLAETPVIDKEELERKKAEYQRRLEMMSAGNPARADIEKHIQELDAQLSAADAGSDWDPNRLNNDDPLGDDEVDEEGGTPVNTKQPNDTCPTSVKGNVATYQADATGTVELHSQPGNKIDTYNILFSPCVDGTPTVLTIDLESPNDKVKVISQAGKYIITVQGAKGKETYNVNADNVTTIHFNGAGDNQVDLSALPLSEQAKFIINNKAPKWASDLPGNIATYDGHNTPIAVNLANLISEAAKSGDWGPVKKLLQTDPIMMQPDQANDVIRKVLSGLCEPAVSKLVDKATDSVSDYVSNKARREQYNPKDDIGCFGAGAAGAKLGGDQYGHWEKEPLGLDWNSKYNWDLHTRYNIGGNVELAKRVAVDLHLEKIPADAKNEILGILRILPEDIRQNMLSGLTADDGECYMGDRFPTGEWRQLIKESLSESDTISTSAAS